MVTGLPSLPVYRRRRNSLTRRLCYTIIVFLFGFALIINYLQGDIVDHDVEDLVKAEIIAERVGLKEVEIDHRCNRVSGTCYIIKDALVEENNKNVVERRIKIQGVGNRNHLLAILHAPYAYGQKFENSDTRMWKINMNVLRGYGTTMALMPVVTEALHLGGKSVYGTFRKESSPEKLHHAIINFSMNESALVLGITGVQIANFQKHKNPKLNFTIVEHDKVAIEIARKWFAADEHKNRIIQGDAIQYIRNAADNGVQFHSVYVDICDDLRCPSPQFLINDVAQNLRKIIRNNGTMLMNILNEISGVPQFEKLQQIADVYSSAFEACLFIHHVHMKNVLLMCSPNRPTSPSAQLRHYERLFPQFTSLFKVPEKDSQVIFSSYYIRKK